MPGTSLSSHSSLASSLTELAGGLGSMPGGPGEGVVPAALTEAGQTTSVLEPNASTKANQSGGVYNPFDSDGTSCIYIALFASSHLTFRCHFSLLQRLGKGLVTIVYSLYTEYRSRSRYGVYFSSSSADNASVGSFGQFEFGEQSSGIGHKLDLPMAVWMYCLVPWPLLSLRFRL